MQFILPTVALALISACATTPTASSPSAGAVSPPGAPNTRVAQLLAAAGGQNAPTQSEIERALGAADVTRHDGAGAALTYRYENCALLLLFAADQRNAMRLAEAHPSARHAGATAPSLDQCAAEASARRS